VENTQENKTKRPLGRTEDKWENKILQETKEIRWECVEWAAYEKITGVLKMVTKRQFSKNWGIS